MAAEAAGVANVAVLGVLFAGLTSSGLRASAQRIVWNGLQWYPLCIFVVSDYRDECSCSLGGVGATLCPIPPSNVMSRSLFTSCMRSLNKSSYFQSAAR